MKLKRLDLTAFGPFTGRTLKFDVKEPGLHIIFGPNEAGKSSALRALKALLYGFPQQTPDDFFHSYSQLLVGGCLENSNGEKINFQRRKKRIGDIIDGKGNHLDPGILAPFLHGIEAEIFDSLYGIDHNTLVQGGEEILAQKGEVGQALFAAGAGISSLGEVIDQLEKEAANLFKSAGQLPEINRAVKRFKDLKTEAKKANLSSRDWTNHKESLKRANIERTGLEEERENTHKELRRLERLEQAIPELASLKAWQDQLQALGEVTLLPSDFAERHQQVGLKTREVGSQLQRDSDRLLQIKKNRKAITFNKNLLGQADLVDDFHQRLGEYRKGQKDRPRIDGIRISLRREAALLLKQVRPDLSLDQVEILRPVIVKKRTIQTLATQYEAINQQLKQVVKNRTVAEQELQEVKKSLAALPKSNNFQGLLQAVKLAQKTGDIDTHLDQVRNEVAQGEESALGELKRIGLFSGNLASLMELHLPLSQTVQQFQIDFSNIEDEKRIQENDRKDAAKELKNAAAEIRKMVYAGDVPSEEELTRIRGKREQGWKLLRKQWLEAKNVAAESADYNAGKQLPEAYEEYVNRADLIADRLRREAGRVANIANLRAQVETLEEILEENKKVKQVVDQRRQRLNAAWAEIWTPAEITPLSPKEMSGWLAETDKLRYKVSDLLKKKHEIDRDTKRRQDLRLAVIKELKTLGKEEIPDGDTLGSILVFGETILEKIARQNASRETIKEKLKSTRHAFDQAAEDFKTTGESLAEWQKQWKKALSSLGIADDVSTFEAIDLIEILQDCFNKLKETDDLKKRIDGIDRDATDLENDVKILLEKVAPDKLVLALDQAILQLRAMLNEAQKNSTLYNKLSEECNSLQLDVSAAEKTLQNANEQMAELLRIAQCEKPEELTAVIGRFTEYQRLQEKISENEASLAKIGLGVRIKELARQAAKVDIDELPGLFESLRREIDDRINPDINKISQVIGEETIKLAAMDGSSKSADIAERMEQELAKIRRLAERYAQVKLASKILQQEIERYREEHQDPVLKIGSTYFAELTVNSFAGLRTDVDDRGNPVLIGMRPDQTRVTVDGMSDGTRDQLYLALRLATLEFRLKTSEPMPFIVDDILINFDDQRSRATLKALARLGTRNQVILFTHHQQIVEDAKNIKNADKIHVHEL